MSFFRIAGGWDVRMPGCQDARMPRCPDVKMSRCQDLEINRYPGIQLSRKFPLDFSDIDVTLQEIQIKLKTNASWTRTR